MTFMQQHIDMIKLMLILIVINGISITLSGQENNKIEFSLSEAQDYAVNYNIDIKNSAIDVAIYHQKVGIISKTSPNTLN